MTENMKGQKEVVSTNQQEETKVYFGFLKPYGKVLGNNVFTYNLPNMDELSNVLNSFPTPVYWITSSNFILSPSIQNILTEHHVLIIANDAASNSTTFPSIDLHLLKEFLEEKAHQNAMIIISCNEEHDAIFKETIDTTILNMRKV